MARIEIPLDEYNHLKSENRALKEEARQKETLLLSSNNMITHYREILDDLMKSSLLTRIFKWTKIQEQWALYK